MKTSDPQFMQLALKEAAKGLGRTAPNPPVGAVIVKKEKVIATGYHRKAGGPHAELVALRKAGRAAKGATLYVTLEPCVHSGKTPPCVDPIIKAGVKKVVVGLRDPHQLVNGRGIRALRRAKVSVSTGVLGAECETFYRPYQVFVTRKRSFVTVKAALSLDGMSATASGESQWLTSSEARLHVHQLRDQVDAILVGRGTVERDDPRLTTRLPGKKKGRDPIRIILDSRLQTSPQARALKVRSTAPTWLVATNEATRMRERLLREGGGRSDPLSYQSLGADRPKGSAGPACQARHHAPAGGRGAYSQLPVFPTPPGRSRLPVPGTDPTRRGGDAVSLRAPGGFLEKSDSAAGAQIRPARAGFMAGSGAIKLL